MPRPIVSDHALARWVSRIALYGNENATHILAAFAESVPFTTDELATIVPRPGHSHYRHPTRDIIFILADDTIITVFTSEETRAGDPQTPQTGYWHEKGANAAKRVRRMKGGR
jgi:hypothetical protein